jgi:hypothetical protein
MKELHDESSEGNKFVIIEPIIKTTEFRDLLVESATSLLNSTGLKIRSIIVEGYFIILRLCDISLNVNAVDILKKISGISYIFIGVAVKPDYETIVNTVITLNSNSLSDGKTYFLKIRSATISLEDEKTKLDQFDLEFHLCSELSSSFNKSIRVENDRAAEVIIYILLSRDMSYISLLVFRGQSIMPVNYLQDSVVCPIFDNISLISFIKVMNSGYSSIPLFFFKRRRNLKRLLKVFENIISAYPIDIIEIYLISIENHMAQLVQKIYANDAKGELLKLEDQSFHWLIFYLSKLMVMKEANLDMKMVVLPLTAYVYPRWLIKETIDMFRKSGKLIFTPLLFNYTSQEFETDVFELAKKGLGFDHQVVNSEQITEPNQEEFRKLLTDIFIDSFQYNSKYIKKITLRIRKDDILDIFDSI